MKKSRKYTKTLSEAKKLFKLKTGTEYGKGIDHYSGIRIHKLQIMKTKTRKYFVGTHLEWLNL